MDLKCGGVPVTLHPSYVSACCITQDLNRMLPTLKLEFSDAGGTLTHLSISDQSIGQWTADIGLTVSDYLNSFVFDVYRRSPEGEVVTSAHYRLVGIGATLNNSLCQEYNRSFNGSVRSTLSTLATEIGCDSVDISSSLGYTLAVTQPGWTTVRFLNYLRRHLSGSGGEVGFHCYVKHVNRKRVFVFKTTEELLKQPASYTYHCGNVGSADNIRLMGYNIKENHLLALMAPSSQRYSYFDWGSGTFKESQFRFAGNSLTENLGYDKSEPLGSNFQSTGRTNEVDGETFAGLIGTSHYQRAYSLTKMWITVPGDPNICPGDCVKLVFGSNPTEMFQTQFSGFWMIEKVAHNFGDRFVSYLALTRNGYDVINRSSTLQTANNRKRV